MARKGSYTPTRGAFKGQMFGTYSAYRSASARAKGFASATAQRTTLKKVSAKEGLAALAHPARRRALEALNLVRHGQSLSAAAREAQTTVSTVKRYVGNALRKKGGRIVATRSDRIAAVMGVPTSSGKKMMVVVGSRSRRLLGEFWAMLHPFAGTGRVDLIKPFLKKTINVEGVEVPLLTDPRTLTRLLKEGRLSLDTLYE